MLRPTLPRIRRIFVLAAALSAFLPVLLFGQDDPNDQPLGDVARSLRKKTPAAQAVIDDDNLSNMMEQAESRRGPGSALRFLMVGESKGFRVSAPDVSCSLSFTANTKALLSSQYAQMDLPAAELQKLEGPAAIEGDTLTVSVFNRTDWHVTEVDVALTVVRKNELEVAWLSSGGTSQVPVVAGNEESEIGPEKKPDTTVIYRIRAAAPPSASTTFTARLSLELAPGEEWHWAIVQAKGYPPQSYQGHPQQTAAQTKDAMPMTPELAEPQGSHAASLSQMTR